MVQLTYVLVGIIMGSFSGFLGIGGGLILIPILLYGYGMSQHQAQGTSLAVMVLPITLLAALRYYRSGNVNIQMSLFIAAGFALGGLIGASVVHKVPEGVLQRVFGVVMLIASIKILFTK